MSAGSTARDEAHELEGRRSLGGVTARGVRVLACLPLALILATACGGSSGGKTASTAPPASATTNPAAAGSSTAPASSAAQITIAGFGFGSPLTVKTGTKITVMNTDGVGHTVTADDGTSFNVSVDGKASATFTAPNKPGTYKFHCSIHPQMHGSLTVTG